MTSNEQHVESVGGYDAGYAAAPCFWGRQPGSLISRLAELETLSGKVVLDLGAGEGKNSAWLSQRGACVEAVEVSELAVTNGRRAFSGSPILWRQADVRTIVRESESVDVVIAYGLLHCLSSSQEIVDVVGSMQRWTRPGGWNVLVAFNSRFQDLERAHPGFFPTLIDHARYIDFYAGWELLAARDSDLTETHPDLGIEHTHSMTRILARKPAT